MNFRHRHRYEYVCTGVRTMSLCKFDMIIVDMLTISEGLLAKTLKLYPQVVMMSTPNRGHRANGL